MLYEVGRKKGREERWTRGAARREEDKIRKEAEPDEECSGAERGKE